MAFPTGAALSSNRPQNRSSWPSSASIRPATWEARSTYSPAGAAASRRWRSRGGRSPATSTSPEKTAKSCRCACSSTLESSIAFLTKPQRGSRASRSRRGICEARWSTFACASSSQDFVAMSSEQKKPAESLVQGLLAEKRELKVLLDRARMDLDEARQRASGPDPRVKELDDEVERLRTQLATARAEATLLREERDELRIGIARVLQQLAADE